MARQNRTPANCGNFGGLICAHLTSAGSAGLARWPAVRVNSILPVPRAVPRKLYTLACGSETREAEGAAGLKSGSNLEKKSR
jgi:hypothetical protein